MHLRNVDLFCEVVRCHSFSKAAEHRNVSQSLVSQAVCALESRLGARLIDRTKRPFDVTPAGQVYYEGCREILDQIRQIEDRVQQMGNKVTGRVRVASIHSISFSEMDAYERRYSERYPDVELEVEYMHPDEVYDRVLADEADFGLVSFPRAGGEVSCIPWLEQELVVVFPPEHKFSGKKTITVQELEGEEFVAFTTDLKIRRQIDRWLRQEKVTVEMVQQFDNIEHIKRAVEAGVGIALLPLPTVRKELDTNSLRLVSLSNVTWCRPVGIVHKRHKHLTSAAQKFVDLLQEDPQARGLRDSTAGAGAGTGKGADPVQDATAAADLASRNASSNGIASTEARSAVQAAARTRRGRRKTVGR